MAVSINRMRARARQLAMQALYQWQITHDDTVDIIEQFRTTQDFNKANFEYFQALVKHCATLEAELLNIIQQNLDRPLEQLDPVERAIMLIGVFELRDQLDVPYRVVINEGVELAKRFGGTEGHKYVNAVLDKSAVQLRAAERGK
ncbi:MAG TPA: transcription antitermination factor NusB [Gammaproteobacteria bacterium]|nr:transcription antitermination factor NusB [Gammaproteobacteria bacterium]